MTEQTTPAARSEAPGIAGALILTVVLMPLGLIFVLLMGQKARKAGHSQQPLWVGFAIGLLIDIVLAVLLTR